MSKRSLVQIPGPKNIGEYSNNEMNICIKMATPIGIMKKSFVELLCASSETTPLLTTMTVIGFGFDSGHNKWPYLTCLPSIDYRGLPIKCPK